MLCEKLSKIKKDDSNLRLNLIKYISPNPRDQHLHENIDQKNAFLKQLNIKNFSSLKS